MHDSKNILPLKCFNSRWKTYTYTVAFQYKIENMYFDDCVSIQCKIEIMYIYYCFNCLNTRLKTYTSHKVFQCKI